MDIYIHRTQLEMGIVEDLEPIAARRWISWSPSLTGQEAPAVSGSRRALLSLERRAKADELWTSIAVGNEYDGVVRSLTDFGAFVDIAASTAWSMSQNCPGTGSVIRLKS